MTFVVVHSGPHRDLGYGRLISKRAGNAVVEFFDSPGDESRPRFTIAVNDIRPRPLPEQARVFWRSPAVGSWHVGRVLNCDGEKVLVQFPNQDIKNLPTAEVFVRWRKPIADPTSYLARMISETPLFADARSGFYKSYVKQRAASLGMGGFISAQIEIERHQFEVVRRVLQDPVQRYLLADEVGLGKTIEAGALIRQFFLDDLTDELARALVLVPNALLYQWTSELTSRFGLDQELNERLWVIPHSEHREIERLLQSGVNLLVVDEAHHLSRSDGKGSEQVFNLVKQHAARIPKVLLLSATPALVDEAGFLRLLHLLDPSAFPLEDIAGFKRRIKARQVIAEAMAALSPENALLLESYLERLVDALPTDSTLAAHVGGLREIIAQVPEQDNPSLLIAIEALRVHVSETYRLHRRILRNRRRSVPGLTPTRQGLRVLQYQDKSAARYVHAFEEWRQAVANSSEDIPAGWTSAAIDGYFASPSALVALLTEQAPRTLMDVSNTLVAAASEYSESDARFATLSRCLAEFERQNAKVVVFCGDAEVADKVYARLSGGDPRAVVRHRTDVYDPEVDQAPADWHRFLSQPLCRVLVCDPSAEEGLNLQGDRRAVVHFDLPLSPNRIEQRLGRIDRYGSGHPIASVALGCESNWYETAWIACLRDGFGVFSRSIASLQYLVDQTMEELSVSIVGSGVEAIDKLTNSLTGPKGIVEQELLRIDQSDAMDALVMSDEKVFEEFEEVDSEWPEMGDAFRNLAVSTLKFGEWKERIQNLTPGDSVARYRFQRGGSVETLLPTSDFVQFFVGAIDFANANSKTPQTFPYSARRATVLKEDVRKRKGRLLRYGDVMVEALAAFTEADDRGRVFAVWRVQAGHEPASEGGCDVFFRYEFLIDADTTLAEGVLSRADSSAADWLNPGAMKRRAHALFRPLFLRIWVSDQLSFVESPSLLEVLNRSYQKTNSHGVPFDFNLNSERWDIMRKRGLYQLEVWEGLCKESRRVAERLARESSELNGVTDHASRALSEFTLMRMSQLGARVTTLEGSLKEAELRHIEREKATLEALKHGFNEPNVKLDSVGAVFLSATHPF